MLLTSPAVQAQTPAQDQEDEPSAFGEDYLIGASVTSGTSHIGDGDRHTSFSPMWSFRVGRLKVSRSRASSLLNAGQGTSEAGVSTELIGRDRYSLAASLRYDSGRSFDEDSDFYGLPDIRRTLRVRGTYRYKITDRLRWGAYADHDILNRGGGMRVNTSLTYRIPVTEANYFDVSGSMRWGDARYLRTYYGVTAASSQATGVAAYRPNAGMETTDLALDFTHIFSDHWVGFVAINASRLMGPARQSPLVGRVNTSAVAFGIAYRNKRRK